MSDYNVVKPRTERQQIILEIDKNPIKDYLRFIKDDEGVDGGKNPLTYSNKISKNDFPYLIVQPLEGFCVKAAIVGGATTEKLFINVCHTDKIPPPENITKEQLLELCASEVESQFRVPMSVSECRTVTNKTVEVTVCDVAISSLFLEKLLKEEIFRDFLITIILETIEHKHGVQVNYQSIVYLQHRKTMSNLVKHRILKRDVTHLYTDYQKQLRTRLDARELDEGEVKVADSARAAAPPRLIEELKSTQVKLKSVQYRLVEIDNKVIGEFYLPDVVDTREIEFNIGEDHMELFVPKHNYSLDGSLAYTINIDEVSTEFDQSRKVFTVTMPTLKRF